MEILIQYPNVNILFQAIQISENFIEDCSDSGQELDVLIKIFDSFISDEISDFNTGLYYQNPSYLECSYQAGKLLDQFLKKNRK